MLASDADIAETFLARLVGLLKTPELSVGQGLHIVSCNQIHMFGMKYAIDAVFINKDLKVVGLCNNIRPGQISALFASAHSCLELPAGIISDTDTVVGDEIETGTAPP